MKFTTRELFLLILITALGLGWWLDRSIYIARANARGDFATVRHWQATTLWLWAEKSDFVESIKSDDHAITISTKDGKVDVFPFPSHSGPNTPIIAP